MSDTFNDVNNKDNKILEALLPYAQKTRSTLSEVDIPYATRKSSICFVLAPEWSPDMPPYAIARLGAITKQAGYQTHVVDINVAAWRDKSNWQGLTFDPWDDNYMTRWFQQEYYTYIHDH